MNRLGILGLSTVAALGLALPGSALSQQKSLKEKLVGTWSQVSIDIAFSDGTKRPLYGENPKGIVIYTSDGYFSLMQARADLPKLASGRSSTATPDEAKAVLAGSIAYFGRYSVDEASNVLTLDIQASTFANQVGDPAENRTITSLTESELKFTRPAWCPAQHLKSSSSERSNQVVSGRVLAPFGSTGPG
jgi:hypothetical protein